MSSAALGKQKADYFRTWTVYQLEKEGVGSGSINAKREADSDYSEWYEAHIEEIMTRQGSGR